MPKRGYMISGRSLTCIVMCASTIWAQAVDISLRGTVSDSVKWPMKGVGISLLRADKVATTNSYGAYEILAGNVGVEKHNQDLDAYVKFSSGTLWFRQVEPNAAVSVDLLDIKGSVIKSVFSSTLSSGIYTLGIPSQSISQQLYVLRLKMGSRTEYKRVTLAHNTLSGLNRVGDAHPAGLNKATAIIDTLTLRYPGYGYIQYPIESYVQTLNFTMKKISTWNGDTNAFWGPRGKDIPLPTSTNNIIYKFINRTNGAFADDEVLWTWNGQTKSIKDQSTLEMGANSGRVNLFLGKDKRYADFIEHTIANGVWNGNTTRVDWYGFPIAIRLHGRTGYDQILGEEYNVFYMGRKKVFDAFKEQVPEKFRHLAGGVDSTRIVCPGAGKFVSNGEYKDYYKAYVDEVWAIQKLTVAKPTVDDVFRCKGAALGGDAQLCGALNRHTAHLPKAQWKVPSFFYLSEPANYYAKFFHDYNFYNKSYGFAYDDAAEMASFASFGNMHYILVVIGY